MIYLGIMSCLKGVIFPITIVILLLNYSNDNIICQNSSVVNQKDKKAKNITGGKNPVVPKKKEGKISQLQSMIYHSAMDMMALGLERSVDYEENLSLRVNLHPKLYVAMGVGAVTTIILSLCIDYYLSNRLKNAKYIMEVFWILDEPQMDKLKKYYLTISNSIGQAHSIGE
jgi:hypothetical protein